MRLPPTSDGRISPTLAGKHTGNGTVAPRPWSTLSTLPRQSPDVRLSHSPGECRTRHLRQVPVVTGQLRCKPHGCWSGGPRWPGAISTLTLRTPARAATIDHTATLHHAATDWRTPSGARRRAESHHGTAPLTRWEGEFCAAGLSLPQQANYHGQSSQRSPTRIASERLPPITRDRDSYLT